MPFIIPQPIRETTAPYVFHKDLLTSEECEKIIDFHKSEKPSEAEVGGANENGSVNDKIRRTELFWIKWQNENTWLFEKMANAVFASNNKFWGFHLAGFNEPLQLTHYRGGSNDFYDWHEDSGDTGAFLLRKLSCVILLNDEFKGGDFEMMRSGKVEELSKGTMIVFPSFKTHRVTPVTEGDRWSLVSWVTGPAFV